MDGISRFLRSKFTATIDDIDAKLRCMVTSALFVLDVGFAGYDFKGTSHVVEISIPKALLKLENNMVSLFPLFCLIN
ncbi:hypothetical protein V6N13_148002 [Hibiscus sabdariffa]